MGRRRSRRQPRNCQQIRVACCCDVWGESTADAKRTTVTTADAFVVGTNGAAAQPPPTQQLSPPPMCLLLERMGRRRSRRQPSIVNQIFAYDCAYLETQRT